MIKLVSCNNPQWANAEKTELYADIEWDVVGRVHRTHLDPRDTAPHVVSVMAGIKAGKYGTIADYVAPPPPTQEELDAAASASVRAERDNKLATEVDPVAGNALRWADLSAAEQAEVAAYRTALLDITEQAGFPETVTWPTKPEVL